MEHILSLIVTVLSLLFCKPWTAREASELLFLLADGFFIGGILLLSAGGLCYVSEKGGFDMLGYTFSALVKRKKGESYYSYVAGKKAGRKWLSPVRDGAVILGVSAVFALMWQIFQR